MRLLGALLLGLASLPAARAQSASGGAAAVLAVPDALAAEVGREVFERGGNAVDAAVAAQFVLGFVEAPETGIGGGGFLLYRDAASGSLHLYDGRETAPLAARPERFRWLGLRAPFAAAVISGRSVGVPGEVHGRRAGA